MEETVTDTDVTAAIKKINQELLPRRINFVPAKFEYKMQINESIVYATNTQYYSICYGNTKKSSSNNRSTLYDPNKLAQIKTWAIRYYSGNGYSDIYKRGFATSVLYCLRACPCFRQFQKFHKESCQRVGCNLCKIYKFFEDTEAHGTITFPLDLNVFDRKWNLGTPGDSAEFLNQLLNVLQSEEFSGSRAFQAANEYSTAIGQMFRIESQNKLVCKDCGRTKIVKDSYWIYFLSNRIDKSSLQSSVSVPVDDYSCDACGKPVLCTEEFINELPLIFTVQLNNWDDKGQFRKKQFQVSRFLELTISGVKYRLVAFTDYNGSSSEGGKFNSVFLSSSGTWNSMINGKVQQNDINSLSKFNPQLLFYSRDEPNASAEKASITPIPQQNKPKIMVKKNKNYEFDEEESENSDNTNDPNRIKSAKDALTKSIEKQLKRNFPQNGDKNTSNEVVVVDTTDVKSRKVDRKKVTSTPAKNPMQMLLKQSRNVHETSTWDGIETDKEERKESAGGWKEEAPDEWDQSLDKGHVRKIKNKRSPPVENPFDQAASQKRAPNDIWKDKKKNKNKFHGNRKFDGKKSKKDKK